MPFTCRRPCSLSGLRGSVENPFGDEKLVVRYGRAGTSNGNGRPSGSGDLQSPLAASNGHQFTQARVRGKAGDLV